jgi:hypothetical protein
VVEIAPKRTERRGENRAINATIVTTDSPANQDQEKIYLTVFSLIILKASKAYNSYRKHII